MPEKLKPQSDCPCQSDLSYAQCCQDFIQQIRIPESAQQLMRSRYSAYVLADSSYILATWHPQYRPKDLTLTFNDPHWIGLKIVQCQAGTISDEEGLVEFIARYKVNGKAHKLKETSLFKQLNNRWYYCQSQ